MPQGKQKLPNRNICNYFLWVCRVVTDKGFQLDGGSCWELIICALSGFSGFSNISATS